MCIYIYVCMYMYGGMCWVDHGRGREHISIYLSVYLSIYLSFFLFAYLFVYLFVYLLPLVKYTSPSRYPAKKAPWMKSKDPLSTQRTPLYRWVENVMWCAGVLGYGLKTCLQRFPGIRSQVVIPDGWGLRAAIPANGDWMGATPQVTRSLFENKFQAEP